MISNPEVNKRLRKFVCTRFSLRERSLYEGRYWLPGTGSWAVLDPEGRYLEDIHEMKGDTKRFRWCWDTAKTIEKLDEVLARHPGHKETADLKKIYWLPYRNSYGDDKNANAFFLSSHDRKPLVLLLANDPLPEDLEMLFEDQKFLLRHYRSYLWSRGVYRAGLVRGGETVTDTLGGRLEEASPELREILAAGTDPVAVFAWVSNYGPKTSLLGRPFRFSPGWKREELEKALDATWLDYMKVRPDVSDRYKHMGGWEDIAPYQRKECEQIQELLKAGRLLPPGRTP